MKVIPFETILSVLKSDGERTYPFLESFSKEYSQKVNEDKKTPLFSKTNKYNSFPIRCHNIKEKSKKRKDLSWFRDKPAITKLKKADELRTVIIRVLNKITVDNFETQSDELLKVLINLKDPRAVKVVAELILEKVWYDKSFYELYVNLCKKLWSNIEWTQPAYKILKGKNKYYFSVLYDGEEDKKNIVGPFKTQEEVEKSANYKVNLKMVFFNLCKNHINKRTEYINNLKDLEDNALYKMKRKIFGTVEILGQFYKMGYLCESTIHIILKSLLNKGEGADYDEEIEALHLTWQIIKDKMTRQAFREYEKCLKKEKEKGWCMRTKFMIDDMLEYINGKSIKIRTRVKPEIKKKTKEEIVNDITKQSRKIILNNIENEYLYEITVSIIKDSLEYKEFLENHLNNLIHIINKISFEKLSEAFSFATENLSDFKIDAPKAPENLSYLVGNLCKTFDDNLQICITPSEKMPEEDIKFIEEEQYKEWKNIEKLAKKYHNNIHINLFKL